MTVSASFELPNGEVFRPELPVCTARVFRDVINPLAEKLNLPLIVGWDTMVEVDKDNYRQFVDQLETLRGDLRDSEIADLEKKHVDSRLAALSECVVDAFDKGLDLVVVVG